MYKKFKYRNYFKTLQFSLKIDLTQATSSVQLPAYVISFFLLFLHIQPREVFYLSVPFPTLLLFGFKSYPLPVQTCLAPSITLNHPSSHPPPPSIRVFSTISYVIIATYPVTISGSVRPFR